MFLRLAVSSQEEIAITQGLVMSALSMSPLSLRLIPHFILSPGAMSAAVNPPSRTKGMLITRR